MGCNYLIIRVSIFLTKNFHSNQMKTQYIVCFKSSGTVVNRFSNLGDAKYWVQQNDVLYSGENGNEPENNAGMFEIKRLKVE